jgi:hypothetical protein
MMGSLEPHLLSSLDWYQWGLLVSLTGVLICVVYIISEFIRILRKGGYRE